MYKAPKCIQQQLMQAEGLLSNLRWQQSDTHIPGAGARMVIAETCQKGIRHS